MDSDLKLPIQLWHSIVPNEGIPQGVDTWTVEIQNIGTLHVGLLDKPGKSASIDDQKAYVLGSSLDGLAVNATTLLSKGYRTLNLVLDPKDSKRNPQASLRADGSNTIFTGVFQTQDLEKKLLTPLSLWAKIQDTINENTEFRDVMVMPDKDLIKIQIHVEGGDN